MRAVVFRSPEEPVAVEDVDLADPGPGEVLVKIASAGVCHSDLHVRRGDWDLPVPLVMGHEGSGVVESIGPGVTGLEVGDHVVLSWVAPCGQCRYCLAGMDVRCEVAADIVALKGTLNDGTSRLSQGGRPMFHYLGTSSFAQYAVVPATGAIKVRKDAPLDVICLIGCAVATGVGAVTNSAQVPPGATVAVIGCGGVGLNIIQGARLAQAERIVAVDLHRPKLALAEQLGATDLIVASEDTAGDIARLIHGGVDFCFDAIGLPVTTEQAMGSLALGGTAVIVGIPPAGQYARLDGQTLVDRDQRVIGSNYGGIKPSRDIPMLVDKFMAGEIQLEPLVSGRSGLAEAEASLTNLGRGEALRHLLIPN